MCRGFTFTRLHCQVITNYNEREQFNKTFINKPPKSCILVLVWKANYLRLPFYLLTFHGRYRLNRVSQRKLFGTAGTEFAGTEYWQLGLVSCLL